MPDRPLDEELLGEYDPQFVDLYNSLMRRQAVMHEMSVDDARRAYDMSMIAEGEPAEVESQVDHEITYKGGTYQVRVFTPKGPTPKGGYPCLIYFHGGGWVIGSLKTDAAYCTHWANHANCVVVSVNYRHAPEHPFPAAVDDAWHSFTWVHENASKLNVNPHRVAVGGTSAGGNLTANVCHMVNLYNAESKKPYPPLVYQMLFIPSVDNSMGKLKHPSVMKYLNVAGAGAEMLLWFSEKYFPEKSALSDVRASPMQYPDASFQQLPPTYFIVAGMDMLRDEAVAYHEKLLKFGVKSELNVYQGMPHIFFGMRAVLDKANEAITGSMEALKKAFNNTSSKL